MISAPLLTPTYSAVYAVEPGTPQKETQPPAGLLLSELTDDLYALLDCEWIVTWEKTASALKLVSSIGACPDLPACRLAAAHLIEEANAHPDQIVHGLSSHVEAMFPVRAFGCLVGAVSLGPKRGRQRYSSSDINLLTGACRHIGSILELPRLACRLATHLLSADRTHQELQAAREVQNRFFPARSASIRGVDYYGECHLNGEVGGDFFDFQLLPGGELSIAVGDVSGKGIPSAIIMAGLQAVLRSLSAHGPKPAAMVAELNSLVCSICPENFFATLFYAQIDPVRRTMAYVNAGHEPPLLLRQSTGRTIRPSVGGTVLGLSNRVQFVEGSLDLEPGDLLIAVTDGITEAANQAGEEFQVGRIQRALSSVPIEHASDAVTQVMHEVEEFSSPAGPADDRTVVAVRILPEARHFLTLPADHVADMYHHA